VKLHKEKEFVNTECPLSSFWLQWFCHPSIHIKSAVSLLKIEHEIPLFSDQKAEICNTLGVSPQVSGVPECGGKECPNCPIRRGAIFAGAVVYHAKRISQMRFRG
jgi:hypothetical protein